MAYFRTRELQIIFLSDYAPWANTRTPLLRSGFLSWVPLGEAVDWLREVYDSIPQFIGMKRT